ncbi:DUF4283 domain protein [Arachis hypogaea]|nr:DUF4283 domain protein [Arachis hypogaea]
MKIAGKDTVSEEERKRLKAVGVILLDDSYIKDGLEVCGRSLVGRIMADKPFSIGTIEPAMFIIWRQPEGFRVVAPGDNTFRFFFKKEQELIRVEKETPWLLKNYIANIRRWSKDMEILAIDFSYIPI